MKLFRFLVCIFLVMTLIMGSTVSFVPVAHAAKKTKVKTEYSIVVEREAGKMHVFSKKSSSQEWKLVGTQICSVGNPFWPTPKGTYTVAKKKKNFSFGGKKYKYVTFSNCPRVTIFAEPNRNKKDYFYQPLGEACTMGPIWLAQKWAKWIYNKIPVGTKIYIF